MSSYERLESDENLVFQERSWRWEAAGRVLIFLLVLAAIAGLLGKGPLSRAEAATEDGRLRVEYPRFARTDATYRVLVHAAVAEGSTIAFWVGAPLLNVLQVESITPEPESVELDRGRVLYRFRAAAPDASPPVILHVKMDGIGRHEGRIGLRDGASANLAFWLYP